MFVTSDDSSTEEAPAGSESVTESQTGSSGTSEQATESTEPQSVEELPAWARSKLTKANNEAAKYRVEAREAEEKARQDVSGEYQKNIAELTDEKASIQAQLDTAQVDLMKIHAALSVGIPGESATEFAELLKGSTKREISAHAEKVKELFNTSSKPSRAIDPSQGAQDGSQKLTAGQMLASVVKSQ